MDDNTAPGTAPAEKRTPVSIKDWTELNAFATAQRDKVEELEQKLEQILAVLEPLQSVLAGALDPSALSQSN